VRFDQDAAAIEPCLTLAVQLGLAEQQRVAAPDQDQIDHQELAGVAQSVELLREADRSGDVVAQRHRRERVERGLDARERGVDGIVGDDRYGIDVREFVLACKRRASAFPRRVDGVTLRQRLTKRRHQLGPRDRIHGPEEYGETARQRLGLRRVTAL